MSKTSDLPHAFDEDAKRREAEKGGQQPKPDPSLIDPEKTPGSGMTTEDGDAPSG